jgi:hypothetical protein
MLGALGRFHENGVIAKLICPVGNCPQEDCFAYAAVQNGYRVELWSPVMSGSEENSDFRIKISAKAGIPG